MSAEDEGTPSHASSGPPEQKWHAPYNPWVISSVATIATFMEVLDTTIVIVALPHIAGNLGIGQDASTWIVTAYLLCNAVVLPFSPWMSSLFGRRNFYLVCVVLFTLSSLLCGIASSFGLLVFFRLLQGLAGGGLLPSTQAILVDTFPAHRRGMAMAMYSLVVVSAPAIGPTLGGWITENFSWRWIFLINVPVGCLSLLLASKFVTDPPYLPRRRGADRFKVDYPGFILIVLGLGGMQLTLSLGERRGWFESDAILFLAIGSAIAIIAAILWELHYRDPLMNLRLLKDRNLASSLALLTLFGFPFYGGMILYPLFLQGLLGYTATWSGLAVSPGGLVMVAMMPIVGWLISRIDPRHLAVTGLVVLSFAMFKMSQFNLETDLRTIVLTRMLQSFGISMIFVPISTMAYTYVRAEARNSASSLISLGRNAGAGIGIAFVANSLERHEQIRQTHLVQHFTPYDPPYTGALARVQDWFVGISGDPVGAASQAHRMLYDVLQEQASQLAFSDVYRTLSALALCLIPLVFIIRRPAHSP